MIAVTHGDLGELLLSVEPKSACRHLLDEVCDIFGELKSPSKSHGLREHNTHRTSDTAVQGTVTVKGKR